VSQRFLLDTNIISDLVRNPQGRVAAQIALHDADAFSTSIIVASELRYGAARKGSRRLTAQIEAILEAIEIHPIERPFDRIYGSLRSQMESTGALIGGNDLLIAAHALQTGRTLVTANEREFMRVPGLKLVNWLA